MIKQLVFILLLLFSPTPLAQPSFVINTTSYHWDNTRDFNHNNFGVGIEIPVVTNTLSVGFYNNSINKTSTYLLYNYFPHTKHISLTTGFITGYNSTVVPAVGLTITNSITKHIGFNLVLTPNIPVYNVFGFCGLQFKYTP